MRDRLARGRAPLGWIAACLLLPGGCRARGPSSSAAAASSGAPAQPSSPSPAPTSSGVLFDSPAWPTGQRHVKFTWVVPLSTPDATHPEMEALRRRDLQLVVQVGSKEWRTVLVAHGPLLPEYQAPCRRLASPGTAAAEGVLRRPDDLAAIQFGRGSFGGYAVRKDTNRSIAIHSWSWDDGGCPDEKGDTHPCPRESVLVRRVAVPESATFEELLVGIDAAGKEHPFSCQVPIE